MKKFLLGTDPYGEKIVPEDLDTTRGHRSRAVLKTACACNCLTGWHDNHKVTLNSSFQPMTLSSYEAICSIGFYKRLKPRERSQFR